MTCVVGAVQDGIVTIAADKQTTSEYERDLTPSNKIFRVEDFLFGVAGYVRHNNIIRYQVIFEPQEDGTDDMTYMVNHVVEAIRASFNNAGASTTKDGEQEALFECLVGYKGNLYQISTNFSMIQVKGYAAIGSGSSYALGALHAYSSLFPRHISLYLEQAVEAAAKFDVYTGVGISKMTLGEQA